ncbi:MAG: hypothetical protein FJ138_12980 [Deltaproteobacteria bacterium]|nr:hypothetical protein [Deltaproteobacteria bacterium]
MSTPITALRARVSFRTEGGLARALDLLSPHMRAPALRQGLLQVVYRPGQLTEGAARLHAAFRDAHPRCSTYLPLCLPGPHSEGAREWSTPEDCAGCIYRRGGRCDGLGGDEAGAGGEAAGAAGALALLTLDERPCPPPAAPAPPPPEDLLSGARPRAYWAPSAALTAEVWALLRAEGCGAMWDVGAGSGLLGRLLCPPEVTLVSVEPLPGYAPRAPLGARHIWSTATAAEALAAHAAGLLPRPDALLLSWSPPGVSFRELVEALRPRVVVRAYDAAGFCGVRGGYRWVEVAEEEGGGARARWAGHAEAEGGWDDAAPPSGCRVALGPVEVVSLYDWRRGGAGREGRVVGFVGVNHAKDSLTA